MTEGYVALIEAVKDAGHFVSWQPIDSPGDRIVCALHHYPAGHPRAGDLHGNSFWVAKRESAWFVANWAPWIYRIPASDRMVELCLDLLRREPAGAYGDFSEPTRRDFGLIPVSVEEFDRAPG